MQQAYLLSRLKTVEPEHPDNHHELERILDHRRRGGKLEYFVKWKHFADSECSWVKETDFDTTEILVEYWEKQTSPTTALYAEAEGFVLTRTRAKQGELFEVPPSSNRETNTMRSKQKPHQIPNPLGWAGAHDWNGYKIPKLRTRSPTDFWMIGIMLICLFCATAGETTTSTLITTRATRVTSVPVAPGLTWTIRRRTTTTKFNSLGFTHNIVSIHGAYQLCAPDVKQMISARDGCQDLVKLSVKPTDAKPANSELVVRHYTVLNRRSALYQFEATQCEVTKVIVEKTVSFMVERFASREEVPVQVSVEECRVMSETGNCHGQPMLCLDRKCEYYKEPTTEFTWWSTDHKEAIKCKLSKRQITINYDKQPVAVGKFGPCLVRHGFCPFPSGVLYWPAQPRTPCPFERVGRYPFKEHRGKIISSGPVNRSNDSLVGHLLFTLKSNQFVCTVWVQVYGFIYVRLDFML